MFVDSHCHLNLDPIRGNLEFYLENAARANVKYMQTICTKLEDVDDLIVIAEKYSNIFCSVGIHPNEKLDKGDNLAEKIIELSKHSKVIGIGETGLDFYKSSNDAALQKKSFIAHINAAQENGLPVIIHSRDADDDTADILEVEMKNKPFKALIHCFTASRKFAYKALDLGCYISVAGVVTFKNASDLQDIIKDLPISSLLIETDSPYLAPVPMRGASNEPSYVSYVAAKLAQLHNISQEEVGAATSENFFKLFDKSYA